jgi:beta-lactamase superfamily II metal-dependent hydrolase
MDRKVLFVLLLCASAVLFVGCLDTTGGEEVSGEGSADGETGEYDDWEPSGPPEMDSETSTYAVSDSDSVIVKARGTTETHFVDVGQADFTLFDGPEFNVVVDTGDWQDDSVVPYLRKQGVEEIDLLVVTHPDADHIGQLDDVVEASDVRVEEVWMSGTPHTTEVYESAMEAVNESGTRYHEPRAGEEYVVESLRVEALHPEEGGLTGDQQKDSVALRLVYGETSFLMTGDAERSGEARMVALAEEGVVSLDSDVYQMGHHGSDTSSTRGFLEKADPEVAVYSAGEDNDFGHPSEEVLERHAEMGVEVYGTDTHGTVVVETEPDGHKVVTEAQDAPLAVPWVGVSPGTVGNFVPTAANPGGVALATP